MSKLSVVDNLDLSIEQTLGMMNLSPTSSPKRSAARNYRVRYTSPVMRHERETQNSINRVRYTSPVMRQENQTPVRQGDHNEAVGAAGSINTYSYMSPRPPTQPQAFLRTHSSPCVIDASPRPNNLNRLKDTTNISIHNREESTTTPSPTSVSGATFSPSKNIKGCHKSELTPVISNAARSASVIYSPGQLEEISVPTAGVFKTNRPNNDNTPNSNTMILPRKTSDGAGNRPQVAMRPISPPSLPVHRQAASSMVHTRQSLLVNPNRGGKNNAFVGTSQFRMRSAFPSPSETPGPGQTVQVPVPVPAPRLLSSASPQTYIAYQPSRDESLAGVGVLNEDGNVDSIFLNNHAYRSHNHSADDSHETLDTASSVSVPSIHHATRLMSDSVSNYSYGGGALIGHGQPLTFFGDDDEDDESSYMVVDEDGDEGNNGEEGTTELITVGEMQCAAFLPEEKPSSSRPSSNSRTKQESRYMSPEKEREVYQWLHSLEVDKDNNEYVAEAASSKFLTGKIRMEVDDEYHNSMNMYNAGLMQPAHAHVPLTSTSSLTFEPSDEKKKGRIFFDGTIQYSFDDSESEDESEYTDTSSQRDLASNASSNPESPKSRSRKSTGNKEVMGINVNLYRSKGGKKKPANQMTLRSRATR